MTNENSNACKPRGFDLPFMQPAICPSASARRKLTRDCIAKQKTVGRLTGPTATVDDNLKIYGKKLHVRSAASRTFCGRPTALDNEAQVFPCTYHNPAGKFDIDSAISLHISFPAENDRHFNCCAGESFGDRRETEVLTVNGDQQLPKQCRAHQHSEQDNTDEYLDVSAAKAQHLRRTEGTYSNVRVDHNRMLKMLRKFDTIRQRAREAREGCLQRFETRQKQRLRLVSLADLERQQQKSGGQGAIGNNPLAPDKSDAAAAWNYMGVQGSRADVKMSDVINMCDPTASAKFQTTWRPALDDSPINVEPTNSVISRLMTQFEHIRLKGVTARLNNQRHFDAKRKRIKYYK